MAIRVSPYTDDLTNAPSDITLKVAADGAERRCDITGSTDQMRRLEWIHRRRMPLRPPRHSFGPRRSGIHTDGVSGAALGVASVRHDSASALPMRAQRREQRRRTT